jgi:Tol biopolymer transport system component
MGRPLLAFGVAAALLGSCASGANAQYFGRNKVQYDHADIRVLATEHFDLYYPRQDLTAALTAGRLAERWYTRLSKVLQHTLRGRQPLILYASHRTFEQTNVWSGLIDERTGGFTESRKRRIVIPFASTLAETDHVLGHEIVHAFQYDIADEAKSPLDVPLWFIEGMAEFLTLGDDDRLTDMWMRDAASRERLPAIRDLSSPRLFPYRWGAALWAYLSERYGADLPARALRAKRDARRRLESLTGDSLETISTAWHRSLRDKYGSAAASASTNAAVVSTAHGGGRLNLAASLSPDGRRMIYFSERDQLSVDLFLADAQTGAVIRKLITTAANTAFDSLQYLHSAGAWNPAGDLFALATIREGRPSLILLDVNGSEPPREIRFDQFDEVYSPTWSPTADSIAFAALTGGATDLFVVELNGQRVRRLTDDQFADVEPAWSPDGRSLAFATDRFSTQLQDLRWGSLQIALLDLASGQLSRLGADPVVSQRDPAWSPDGTSVFFVGDHGPISNIFRFDRPSGRVFQVTDVSTGVSGVTRLSPALSMATASGTLAYSIFTGGGYEIHTIESGAALDGRVIDQLSAPGTAASTSPRIDDDAQVPQLPAIVDPDSRVSSDRKYRPKLGLEALGMPYFSAGGGAFGTSVQGGTSFLFGDLLGDRQLFTAVHLSSKVDESAFMATYLDRGSRRNWGLTLNQVPQVGQWRSPIEAGEDGTTLMRTRERRVWTERGISAFVAYPLNRWKRIEFSVGARQNMYERDAETDIVSSTTGRLIETQPADVADASPLTVGEVSVALVEDTTIFGGTGPILGSRYRFQIAPVAGGATYVNVLADYRRYMMPVRPYTIALRVLHSARYGPGSDDPRLLSTYLGSSWLVRGYGPSRVAGSECGAGPCPALDHMLGTGVLVGKLEVRAPLLSVFSSRIHYGALPLDVFAFADAGTTWGSADRPFGLTTLSHALIRSIGGGVRANAMGLVVDAGAERPLDLRQGGWRFSVNIRPAF